MTKAGSINPQSSVHRFKSYLAYKDTGIGWLGAVPARWIPRRLMYSLCRNDGGVWGDEPTGFDDTVVLRSTEQTVDGRWQIEDPAMRSLSYAEKQYSLLEQGDLIITKSSGSSAHIGKTSIVDEQVSLLQPSFSNFMQRLRCNKTTIPKFIWYCLNNPIAREQFDYLSNTTTGLANLTAGTISRIWLSLPSEQEQRTITVFLDRETERIDQLISRKERQIELLQKKRSALISHAVTKGLNPKAKMKDSGIEWLGEIPKHWEVSKLKHISSVKGRIGFRGYTSDDLVNEGEGALTLGATQIDEYGNIDLTAPVFISWEKYYESPEIMIEPEDILVVQRGSTCGKVGIVPKPFDRATINPSVVLLKRQRIQSKFIFYQLQATYLKAKIDSLVSSTSIPMLSQEQISNLPFVYPDDSEQHLIVKYIEDQSLQMRNILLKVKQSIDMLLEYRSALISATVTGKIDVREEVA